MACVHLGFLRPRSGEMVQNVFHSVGMAISAEPTSPTSTGSNLLPSLDFWADDTMYLFLIRSKDLKKWLQLFWVIANMKFQWIPSHASLRRTKFLLISPGISGPSSSLVSAMKVLPHIFGKPLEKAVTLPTKVCVPWRQVWLRGNIYCICPCLAYTKMSTCILHDTLLPKIWGAFQQGTLGM